MKNLIRKAKAFVTAILDERTEFADATSVIQAVGSAILGDVIPMDTTGFNLGNSMTPVYLVIGVTTEVDSAADGASIEFKLMSDSDTTITDGTLHVTTGAVAEASLTAGTIVHCQPLPQGVYEDYVGVVFTVSGEDVTAGAVNAYLTLDPPNAWKAYPSAVPAVVLP